MSAWIARRTSERERRPGDRRPPVGAPRIYAAPGEWVPQTRPGDVLLTRRRDIVADAAVLGARLRGRGRPEFNHAALVIGSHGELIEATSSGVRFSHLGRYLREERVIVSVLDGADARGRAMAHAWRLRRRLDEWDLLAAVARAVAGAPPSRGLTPAQLVAACLHAGGWPIEPEHATMTDLQAL